MNRYRSENMNNIGRMHNTLGQEIKYKIKNNFTAESIILPYLKIYLTKINFANLWSLMARLIFHLIEISMASIHNADRLDSLIQISSPSRNNLINS